MPQFGTVSHQRGRDAGCFDWRKTETPTERAALPYRGRGGTTGSMLWACTLLSGGLLWRAGPLRDSTCARHGGNKTSLKHETSRARERHTNFAPQASHRASPVRPISLRSPAPCLPPCCPGHAPRRLRQLHLGRLSSRNHSSSMDFGYFRSSRVAAGCGASTSDRARSLSASGIDAARAGFDPTLG
jgi:hypothetical protein